MSKTKLSVHLTFLLRHQPEAAGLDMDLHGWVDIDQLITNINAQGRFSLNRELLDEIVATDNKGRFRISDDGRRIKACQGHSIPWVIPELTCCEPPEVLYHGTTVKAYNQILASGAISRMKRHAVHMQADPEKAWQSAERWHIAPALLRIDAARMAQDGFEFGVSDNDVWCTESVPCEYILEALYSRE